jgi:glycerophosphoryl diester phosphodiesterase
VCAKCRSRPWNRRQPHFDCRARRYSLEEVTVAYPGASTSKLGEGTLPAYQYAVRNHADILDADVHWTKDGPDRDTVGTVVILHDATLDRVTNCTGNVSSWLWSQSSTNVALTSAARS